ncbi:MAG: hypothetical protein AAFY60_22550 [Myxococcota bacterium]
MKMMPPSFETVAYSQQFALMGGIALFRCGELSTLESDRAPILLEKTAERDAACVRRQLEFSHGRIDELQGWG